MTPLVIIRHGPTRWNAEGRIQGCTDVALSPEGVAEVGRWRLSDEFGGYRWFASPLLRAVQTARLLGARTITFEPILGEMRWGAWEGQRLDDIRRQDPDGTADIEARGLDFSAPGGESPRQVQTRLAPFFAARAAEGVPAIAVTHKGVIRALYARAINWPMLGKAPDRLDWSAAHLFRLAPDGTPAIEQLNITLRSPDDDTPCPPRLF
ncbi:MAG: histidine phosphatase family protein [Alphaproteobacteria bacterium]|nr:histidine phosphatase family protein [Alphaproteobacteria bacterium]